MPVWNIWKAECDTCRKNTLAAWYSQTSLLEALRRADWKYKRVKKDSGYTKLVVTCPECLKAQFDTPPIGE